jgi:hypothetical protein
MDGAGAHGREQHRRLEFRLRQAEHRLAEAGNAQLAHPFERLL